MRLAHEAPWNVFPTDLAVYVCVLYKLADTRNVQFTVEKYGVKTKGGVNRVCHAKLKTFVELMRPISVVVSMEDYYGPGGVLDYEEPGCTSQTG